nr:MAG TPA: major prion protein [Caudoviricetes sp.]
MKFNAWVVRLPIILKRKELSFLGLCKKSPLLQTLYNIY